MVTVVNILCSRGHSLEVDLLVSFKQRDIYLVLSHWNCRLLYTT